MRRPAPPPRHPRLDGSLVAVCAPNAFKGTLSAQGAAAAMARGVRDAGADAIEIPVADGGDGTLDVLLRARVSEARLTRHRVTGPTGPGVTARLGWLGAHEAVVELAEASGLRRLEAGALDALHATSRGTGELIRIALEAGARTIIVGVGGSACTDGGAGLLQALGARLTTANGEEIGFGGAGLEALDAIDMSVASEALSRCSIRVACDVRSPLLGPLGAAQMFAPQKGATPDQVTRLERALTRFALLASGLGDGDLAALPGAGAAGGCGFGLALAGARLLPGAHLVCDLVGLDASMSKATVAITGEGRLDGQTSAGKAPAEVAARSAIRGVPCIAIAGSILDPLPRLFNAVVSLEDLDAGVDPMRHTRALLRMAARRVIEGMRPGRPIREP
ncbi:MAG: glycerate kinase [Candidatus Dormibacteria bacterium]